MAAISLRLLTAVIGLIALIMLLWTTQRLRCSNTTASSSSYVAPSATVTRLRRLRPCSAEALRRRYVLQADRLPEGLPGLPSVPLHLTFATASVDELLTNWALHARRLRLPAVVAAMDADVVERCVALRIKSLPTLDASAEEELAKEAKAQKAKSPSDVNIRGNPILFNSLGGRKVGAIILLLERSGRDVLVSDVDVVWLSDPMEVMAGRLAGYEDLAHADILASSDCLNPALDISDHGCFNTLLDRNTGMLLIRNTSASLLSMREWQVRTTGAHQAWETDQTAFDDLLRGRGRGHQRNMTGAQRTAHYAFKKTWCDLPPNTPETTSMGSISDVGGRHTLGSRRLFDVCIPPVTRALRFGLLPLALFANGHSFFVQQLQLQTGVWPHGVHATYQFEDQMDCAFGKRERMREWGLWLADGDGAGAGGDVRALEARERTDGRVGIIGADGVGGDDGAGQEGCEIPPPRRRPSVADELIGSERFLVVTDDEPVAVSVPWSLADPHARGRQHVEHMNRFRDKLVMAVALARVLNRTVVLPPMYCYCDRYWARLTQCTVGEQAVKTQPLPFQCPMDHILPIAKWHGDMNHRRARGRCRLASRADGPPEDGFPYRTHQWLRAVRHAAPHLANLGGALVPADTQRAKGTPLGGADLIGGMPLPLAANSSDEQLVHALRQLGAEHRPLLRVSLDHAGQLLGCVSDAKKMRFLLDPLFRFRWCWRPEEMKEPRKDPKTNATIDVCVWGFELPTFPRQCSSGGSAVPLPRVACKELNCDPVFPW